MINHETELKLQAYLDGEISSGEANVMRELLQRETEARSLFEELKATNTLLAGNELEFKLTDTREFYWSKIRRQIESEEQRASAAETREPVSAWWVRFLAPAAVLIALAVFIAFALQKPDASSGLWAVDDGHEIETPLEETSSFSFRSEAAAMTVVWVDSHRE
jgi:anti-sigma factor RsiW